MSNDLYEMTKNIWLSKDCDELSTRWANELEEAKTKALSIARFYERKPFKIFTSLSNARKPKSVFSLRYQGQEVAEIIADKEVVISIQPKHEKNNFVWFKLKTPSGNHTWKSSKAAAFRKKFEEYNKLPSKRNEMKSDEAWLQSIIFETMKKTGEAGYHGCQPVLFGRFPFQCPIPINANSGVPKEKKGNLDILARRGHGNTHPAIWELKKPKTCKTAFEQVYIYGVTFALMLRSKSGDLWYKNMEYTGKLNIDKPLTIDLIVTLTKDRESELRNHLNTFTDPLRLSDENVVLKPFVAFYEWDKEKDKVTIDELIDLSKDIKKA